ncbi:heme exporter protein CcmD [Cellvibrio japonicus]|uniref:Heme exporter protein D n=1 Tax=Cellvibrio japonicus (strain Ueda107) TaxID=498211 RepID=B3PIC6_CELJU|nr:heme exporter protein CcmD [Cellvibrio japonicus]ACE86297.1 heme exporter protein CcmD [Cellvibrio japonicus Ueda107]QEI12528.1 heme exporter protein CcmD [Cellvibrio japonicus]QEI16102.1 heme exporter protein CcmD [Cellvibrio japonicus]QEI19680.1 heme exporter protein CcmD [Cellvibrio japonicus]
MQFQFSDLVDFVAMNGHGPFVWAAYAITLVALAVLIVVPLVQQRRFVRAHRLQQKREQQERNQY